MLPEGERHAIDAASSARPINCAFPADALALLTSVMEVSTASGNTCNNTHTLRLHPLVHETRDGWLKLLRCGKCLS